MITGKDISLLGDSTTESLLEEAAATLDELAAELRSLGQNDAAGKAKELAARLAIAHVIGTRNQDLTDEK